MEGRIVGPLLQSNLEAVREFKETRKAYERIVEKYDSNLSRPDRSFREVQPLSALTAHSLQLT